MCGFVPIRKNLRYYPWPGVQIGFYAGKIVKITNFTHDTKSLKMSVDSFYFILNNGKNIAINFG